MALDGAFFDAIHIDVVKKKYYNANKVHALLEDIRGQAAALNEENAALREQLKGLSDKKSEIGDTLMSAQAMAKQIVEQANEQAARIIEEAEARRRALMEAASRQQEHAAKCVEECFAKVKRQHMECIETLNTDWQEFLCGLIPEEQPGESGESAESEARAEEEDTSKESASEESDGALLNASELEARVAEIAKELKEIIGENE